MWTGSSNFHQDSKSKWMEEIEVRNPETAWTGKDFYYTNVCD